MTFGESKAKGHPYFVISEGRSEQLRRFAYLEELAQANKVSIAEWLMKPFCDGAQQLFSKNSLSKIFREEFVKREATPEPTGGELLKAYDAFTKETVRMNVGNRVINKARLQNHIEAALSSAHTALTSYENHVTNAARFQSMLDGERPTARSLKKTVKEILADGFYQFLRHDARRCTISFTTKDVFISAQNRKAGLDLRLNLGSFRIEIDFKNLGFSVHENQGNYFVGENCVMHPFVRRGYGGICWGNATATFERLALHRDIGGVMALLRELLHSNGLSGAPYISIDVLVRHVEKKQLELLRASALPLPPNLLEAAEQEEFAYARVNGRAFALADALPMEFDRGRIRRSLEREIIAWPLDGQTRADYVRYLHGVAEQHALLASVEAPAAEVPSDAHPSADPQPADASLEQIEVRVRSAVEETPERATEEGDLLLPVGLVMDYAGPSLEGEWGGANRRVPARLTYAMAAGGGSGAAGDLQPRNIFTVEYQNAQLEPRRLQFSSLAEAAAAIGIESQTENSGIRRILSQDNDE